MGQTEIRESNIELDQLRAENERDRSQGNTPDETDPFVPKEGIDIPKRPDIKAKNLPSPFSLNIFTIVLASFTIALTMFSIVFVVASTSTVSPLARIIPQGYALSLNLLRIVTEIVGLLLAALCDSVLEVIVWRLVSGVDGLPLSSMLGISPSTGFLGLCRLLFFWPNVSSADSHRFWACIRCVSPNIQLICRLLLLMLLPLSKLVVTCALTLCVPC